MSTPPGGLTPWAARKLMQGHSPRKWIGRALCSQTDPEIFFPEKGGSPTQAKKICASCEVAVACLQYVLSSPTELDGIWAGTTVRERRDMRRNRRAAS